MKGIKILAGCLAGLIFAGCVQKGDPAINQIDQSVDEGIKGNKALKKKQDQSSLVNDNVLLSKLSLPDQKSVNSQRFDVSVDNMPAQTFFSGLVSDTQYNIVVSPEVNQSISLSLKNVTVPEVLRTTASLYDLEFKKTSSGYEVFPAGLTTRTFRINYLDIVRSGLSSTLVKSGSLTNESQRPGSNQGGMGGMGGMGMMGGGFGGFSGINSSQIAGSSNDSDRADPSMNLGLLAASNSLRLSTSVISQSESNFWDELRKSLDLFIGEKNSDNVVISPQSGAVTVRTTKKKADMIAEYIDELQKTMNRQVLLEAKIMEVQLNDDYKAGIDWNVFGVDQSLNQAFEGTGAADALARNLTDVFSMSATWGGDKFASVIRLLSTQGNVQVLSSPRVSTMNNQKAVMKVGTDSFFITGIGGGFGGGLGDGTFENIDIEPFFSGLALSVTPQIAPDNDIILHIHPIISDVSTKELRFNVNGDSEEEGNQQQQIPTASSKIKESDSIVRAQNGQMVVIAGLMGSETRETINSVPYLGKIPYLGTLFRSTEQESVRTEMVILLRPVIIINGREWTDDMEKLKERYKKLNQGFHFGSHPDRFGTEGELEYNE